jgi:hypothetical protein
MRSPIPAPLVALFILPSGRRQLYRLKLALARPQNLLTSKFSRKFMLFESDPYVTVLHPALAFPHLIVK